jgi:hypothetical protein
LGRGGEALNLGLVLAKSGYPRRDGLGFEQGVVSVVGATRVRQQVAQMQFRGPQVLPQAGKQAGQLQAVAAFCKIGLHGADGTVGRVDCQAAEVVEGAGLAGFEGDARVGAGGAPMRLVAEQTGWRRARVPTGA